MSDDGHPGQLSPFDQANEFNERVFFWKQQLNLCETATLVQVTKITEANDGSVEPIGFLSALPLVNMLDGAGKAFKHVAVQNLCYSRLQSGTKAVIMDPKVGDIGVAVFASRDISSVKKNKAQANPGSRRRFDMADGIFLFTVLGAKPTSWLRFYDEGIEVSPDEGKTKFVLTAGKIEATLEGGERITVEAGKATVKAATILLDGAVQITGTVSGLDGTGTLHVNVPIESTKDISTTQEVTADGIPLSTHTHPGVQSGGSNTDGPEAP